MQTLERQGINTGIFFSDMDGRSNGVKERHEVIKKKVHSGKEKKKTKMPPNDDFLTSIGSLNRFGGGV